MPRKKKYKEKPIEPPEQFALELLKEDFLELLGKHRCVLVEVVAVRLHKQPDGFNNPRVVQHTIYCEDAPPSLAILDAVEAQGQQLAGFLRELLRRGEESLKKREKKQKEQDDDPVG